MFRLVTRSRYEADLAAAKAETDQQRERADEAEANAKTWRHAQQTAARQFAEADAANRRLNGRLLELGRRLAAHAEADPEYTAELEQRVQRLARGTARWMAAAWAARAENAKISKQVEQASATILSLTKSLVEARDAANPRPIDGGTTGPVPASAALLQARAHARELDRRLAELQNANEGFAKAQYDAADGPRFDQGQTFPSQPATPAAGWGLGGAS